ncbi:rCG57062 [Rattus norvegicus]|uniref:RCG57062 n=1 Tax=Rattus norvegicus TaxID=10116 RepID=A6JDA4_RAT|nr:rCG57062 [Rattus norvegicus]
MPLIPAFGMQKQADLCEFKVNFMYIVTSRTVRAT